jgi:6-phosphogluconolactonase
LGSFPRDFEINPAGNMLVAANQKSGSLVSYYIDKNSGLLEPTGYKAGIADVVCVKFTKLEY